MPEKPKSGTEDSTVKDADKKSADVAGEPSAKDAKEPKGDDKKGELITRAFLDAEISRLHKQFEDRFAEREQTLKEKLEAEKAAERQAEEEKRLQDQGKFQELYEHKEKELSELQAKIARAEFVERSRTALKEADLGDFADLVLAPRETPEDIVKFATELRERIDAVKNAEVEATVKERLTTGKRTTGGVPIGQVTKFEDLKTDAEKLAYIKANGAAAFQQLVEQGR